MGGGFPPLWLIPGKKENFSAFYSTIHPSAADHDIILFNPSALNMGLVAPPLFGDANIVWVRREDETTLYGTMKERDSVLLPRSLRGEGERRAIVLPAGVPFMLATDSTIA